MGNWKSMLKADPADWLLEKNNPSVRYFTLTEILDKSEDEPEVKETKKEIMTVGIVPAILSRQNDEGYWETAGGFYTKKYNGTVWQLIILAELGADGGNERIRKACEFILKNSQDTESGGFSMHASAKTGGGRHSEIIPCLTGNMIRSLIRLGNLEDSRVQCGINWIVKYQRFDDGIHEASTGWPYDKFEICWGKHTCHMGAVKALKALAEIPKDKRSERVKNMIEIGSEYILIHHIYKKSHDLSSISKPGWLRFAFPLMYQTDALEILGILTKLGYKDKRMQEAVDFVVSKQNTQGRWVLENTFNERFQVNIEEKGKLSKWVTLNALKVLKRFYGE
jgi:hypothetical protein